MVFSDLVSLQALFTQERKDEEKREKKLKKKEERLKRKNNEKKVQEVGEYANCNMIQLIINRH